MQLIGGVLRVKKQFPAFISWLNPQVSGKNQIVRQWIECEVLRVVLQRYHINAEILAIDYRQVYSDLKGELLKIAMDLN